MKIWTAAIVGILGLGLLGVSDVQAAKKDKKKDAGMMGQISKIEGSAPTLTLTLTTGKAKKKKGADAAAPITITTDASTSVTVDGQTKTLADLRVSEYVKISGTGTAKTIDASTSAPAKGEKKAKKKKV